MNPLLLLQVLGPLLGTITKPAPAEQAGAPPAGIDPAVLAAILAASRQSPEPALQPQPLPGVVSVLAVGLPAATLIAMISMAVVIAVGGSIGEQQTALLIALSICLGALIVLSATAVNFLLGSSLGSWTKNFRPVTPPPVALPPVQPPSDPVVIPPPPEQPEQPEQRPPVDAGIGRSTDPSTATLRSDVPYDGRVASIRYCNPGAQYPSQRAAAFGQTGYGLIGGGHKIARFPHPVNGAAANFDLLSRNYTGMTVAEAGDKWTGGNGHGIPGYDDGTVLTKEMIADPAKAIPIMKAIAQREAGKKNTLTDVQWQAAHAMFVAGSADAWLAQHHTAAPGETDRKNASGSDIVALAKTRIGEKYVNVQVPKDDPTWHGPWDCAEFASWLVYQTAGILYGCTDDTTDPAKADAYTGAWKTDAAAKGRLVPVSEAAGTSGAFLLRYPQLRVKWAT